MDISRASVLDGENVCPRNLCSPKGVNIESRMYELNKSAHKQPHPASASAFISWWTRMGVLGVGVCGSRSEEDFVPWI